VRAAPSLGGGAVTSGIGQQPSARPTTAQPVAADSSGPDGAKAPRILVLDDEPSIRVFLDKALRSFGYAVVTARSGEEAIEIARDQDFDVYLVDHQMAGATGLDVFESVTEARPESAARFVIMSGDLLNGALRRFTVGHEVTLLSKPFDLATLRSTIDSIARRLDAD